MKTLFDQAVYQDVLARIDAVRPDSPRQWGKMTPSQMMEHVARALDMATGRKPRPQALLGKLIGWIFFKDFVGEKPFGKDGPTGPDFIVADQPDFEQTKARFRELVEALYAMGESGCDGHIHGFFGPLTGAQWGITQFKHIDHHLRQFGC